MHVATPIEISDDEELPLDSIGEMIGYSPLVVLRALKVCTEQLLTGFWMLHKSKRVPLEARPGFFISDI